MSAQRVDAKKCGTCPFYRKAGLLRREKCDFPGVPIPMSCPILNSGPRVMSYGEAMAAEVAWLEIRNLDGVIMVVPVEITGEMYLQGVKGTWRAEEIAPRRGDGRCTRFWDGRPTEEQRKAVEWDES